MDEPPTRESDLGRNPKESVGPPVCLPITTVSRIFKPYESIENEERGDQNRQ